ncbi:hypothetical protein, partial [Staphylococcus aureus]|uniref:hypothetical protein n=1 Tax=Staphylococcus aureus TaxID=1280 RepID=UPI001F3D8B8D
MRSRRCCKSCINRRNLPPPPRPPKRQSRSARARPPIPDDLADAFEAAAFLSHCRNDLEPPARALVPEVGDVLETLWGEPETLLARLSGS